MTCATYEYAQRRLFTLRSRLLSLVPSRASYTVTNIQIVRKPLFGDVNLAIAEKETDKDDNENPIKYLATNKIDAPTEHVIRSYAMRWRIETFFEDLKRDLGLGDCEMQTDEGANRHCYLLMTAYILLVLVLSQVPWDGSLKGVIASSEPQIFPERDRTQLSLVSPGQR